MEQQAILTADYLDILFDRRNKRYGGYELRKNYDRRIKTAMGIILIGAVCLFIYPVLVRAERNTAAYDSSTETVIADLFVDPPAEEPLVIPPPAAARPQSRVETIVWSAPEIAEDRDVTDNELLKTNEEAARITFGNETLAGDPAGDMIPSRSDGTDKEGVEHAVTPTIVDFVDQMPEFDGDRNSYLREHISYPEAARQNGIQGKVIIRFVVNEDGGISDVRSVRGIGYGCDEEAIRVVSAMPKWKPGKLNGKAVKVYFTLPISFLLD